MARYHGKGGIVYMSASGSAAATATVSLNHWSLDKKTDKAEVTAFTDANKVFVQGLPDVSGQLSGFFDDTNDALFDAAESADGVKLYLYPSSLAPTIYHYGPAWVDASIDVAVGGAVAINGSFVAAGSWGRKP